jgi:tetratricopeptide (TPR) repeat protein
LDATAGSSFRTFPVRRAWVAFAALALHLAACASAGPGGRPPGAADRALNAGDLGRAEALYRSAAEAPGAASPAKAEAAANLGVALARQGRWAEAAAALEAATAMNGDAPEAATAAHVLFDLGVAYRHLGRYDDARAAYERALALAPGDVDIAYNLGILYELYLNRPGPALAAYRRYVAAGGPEAARVSRWIEAIETRQRAQGGNLP